MPSNILKGQYLRAKAAEYAEKWIGTPYLFGGDDFSGFDCSGLVIEILQSVGILGHGRDYTANDLWQIYKPVEIKGNPYQGCLAFWFKGTRAIHVEFCIDDYHTVGASGGGSSTTTLTQAIAQNAFTKMRPIGYRGGGFRICDPFKETVS